MKKIEQEMLEAIRDKRPWEKDNTRVIYIPQIDSIGVSLHGELIARDVGYGWEIAWNTLRTTPKVHTKTTASRLRAIGFNVHLRGGLMLVEE